MRVPSRPNEPSVRIDRLLEVAAVAPDVAAVAVQVEDRVADELPGAVVGRFAAAVGLDDLDVDAVREVELPVHGAPADGDHRGMLEQDDGVGDRALQHLGRKRALERPRLRVRAGPNCSRWRGARHRVRLALALPGSAAPRRP